MKKILVILLLLAVSSGIFAPEAAAQFHWSLSSQFNVQLFSFQSPLGERAEKAIMIGDSIYYNDIAVNNPLTPTNVVPYGIIRGNYTYFGYNQNLFNYGRGSWIAANYLRLALGYSSENITFHIITYLDRLVRSSESNANEGIGKDDFNAGSSDHSFVAGDGKTPNWSALLRYAFEEWHISGTYGIFTGYVGTVSDYGKVLDFNNQNNALLRGIQVDNYGVLAPTQYGDFVHDGLDTNNLLRSGAPNTSDLSAKYTSIPYIMAALRFENRLPFPLTLQLAGDPGNNSGIGSETGFSYRRVQGAFRVSGEDIGEHVNFDAIYKIAGGDPVTADDYDLVDNPIGSLQPSGDGFLTHNFGIYANVLNMAGFGFGFGYSGYLKTYEDARRKDSMKIVSRTGALFSGIDLRIQYAGIDKLVITSFNNISFAKTEVSAPEGIVIGVTGVQLPNDTMQDWLALFNAFTAVYELTERFAISAQFGHRYGIITTEISSINAESVLIKSRRQLGGGAYAAYRFPCCNFQIGIALRRIYESYSNTGTPNVGANFQTIAGFRDASGGTFDFAIPIQLTISF